MEMMLRHQNTMLALRAEMGWPSFKPANDCLAFTSGKEMDVETGMEIARVVNMLGKDLIYAGSASTKAPEPSEFTVGYRMMFSVDIVDKVVPYAANDTAPLTLVSTRADEFFAIDQRGSLVRVPGKPKDIRKGRNLAMKRIKARAATMGARCCRATGTCRPDRAGSSQTSPRSKPSSALADRPRTPAPGSAILFSK